jgi:hypothetical protein
MHVCMLAWLVDTTDFRLSRSEWRIEAVDAATWMRVRVHVCALDYRFERQAKCGKDGAVQTTARSSDARP